MSKGYKHLSDAVAEECDIPPAQAKALISLGAVYVDRMRRLDNQAAAAGTYLRVHTKPRRFATPNHDKKNLIIFENENFLIANKPQGLPSHPTLDNAKENLLFILQDHTPVFITHRLDQFTAGLILFAKTQTFQRQFSKCLERRLAKKEYLTITHGPLPLGPMIDYMSPKPVTPRALTADLKPGWKYCELQVLTSEKAKNGYFESRLQLITGRTHQIRAQLASRGQPIIGDASYGSALPLLKFPTLIAQKLEFPGPLKEPWSFSLPTR